MGFRSFDRQWLIPDGRVIDFPRRELWQAHSDRQIYLTEPRTQPVTAGPALTFTADLPDVDHYHGRGGRAVPLYRDKAATLPNTTPKLLDLLSSRLGFDVTGEDLFAYVAGVAAHSGFSERFASALDGTGVRVPLTAEASLFEEARRIGCRVIWLHSYGRRCVDPSEGRPAGEPRLPDDRRPRAAVEIPIEPESFPRRVKYEPATQTLHVGEGQIRPVPPAVWAYEVSGMRVMRKWFRSRIGKPTGRHPTPLDYVRPEHWTSAMNDGLRDLLHVLGLLIDLEPAQRDVLERVCAGPRIAVDELLRAGVLPVPRSAQRRVPADDAQTALF